VVTVNTAIEGWPVILSDTAGFRVTQDELESAGIELATNTLSRAELAIFVYDATMLRAGSSDNKTKIDHPKLPSHARAIHVINKIDLLSELERLSVVDRFTNSLPEIGQPHLVSALKREGVAELMSAIGRALVPDSFPAGTAVPFTAEQVAALAAAKAAIVERHAKAAIDLLHALLTGSGVVE
jgi:tRNA modification GTPase